ncbi:MAG: hypothetical protein AAF798_05805, partial [Bacteroidota bacterium]
MTPNFYHSKRIGSARTLAQLLFTGLFMLFYLSMSAQPPSNNRCINAISLSCGDTEVGTTTDATRINQPGFCVEPMGSAPGVWYVIEGNGDIVVASTCSEITNFDTKIGVFAGNCANLECVTGNDDRPCGPVETASRVFFQTEVGVNYYLYVTGFGEETGDFELSINCITPPENDDVCAATPVSCDETVMGTTRGATRAGNPGYCREDLSTAPGVWYVFSGNGDFVVASTCNPNTDFDTQLGVFEGVCEELECVTGNDDRPCGSAEDASRVFFQSEIGVDYYIYVTGFDNERGDFGLRINCIPPPDNDNVCDATPLAFDELTEFSNVAATVEPGEPSPGPGSGPNDSCLSDDGWCEEEVVVDNSVWFTFISPVECVNITVLGQD